MKEVIGLPLVDHSLGKIGHGLAPPQAKLTAEAQARHRQGYGEGQADLLRRRPQFGLSPKGGRRLSVRRKPLAASSSEGGPK